MQTHIEFSLVALLLLGVIVTAVVMGGLSLLVMLIKALTGRRRPQTPKEIGAWSGVTTALKITAAVFAVMLSIVLLTVARMRTTSRDIETTQSSSQEGLTRAKTQRIRDESEINPVGLIPVDIPEISTVPTESALTSLPAELPADTAEVPATAPPGTTTAEQAAFIEARKVQLRELAARFGELVRSRLESGGEHAGASPLGHAAKSANGDIVVFQPSADMVALLLGAAGQDLMKSFNSELPGRIRQTYALIPLTPPVGATVPVKPLLAAGGLESIANSIVLMVEQTEGPELPQIHVADSLPAESGDTLTVAPLVQLTEPDWLKSTDGRRIVAHTRPIMLGDDGEGPLTTAINEALAKHVAGFTATMNIALHDQARFVRMELPRADAMQCVIEKFERWETFNTEAEGDKSFRVLYALLEFPESVDQMAVQQIRHSIQQDRIASLGLVVGCIWLSICSAGIGIRQWRTGTRLRRLAAAPVFAVITIPMLLIAAGMVVAISRGNVPHAPWNSKPVTVELPDV